MMRIDRRCEEGGSREGGGSRGAGFGSLWLISVHEAQGLVLRFMITYGPTSSTTR